MAELQKFGDVVPAMRESTHEGEQVQVADLVGEKFNIIAVEVDSDDRGEWGDVQIEHKKGKKTFITGSGPLIDSLKLITEKKLLDGGPIETTLESRQSKTSRFRYYVFV